MKRVMMCAVESGGLRVSKVCHYHKLGGRRTLVWSDVVAGRGVVCEGGILPVELTGVLLGIPHDVL